MKLTGEQAPKRCMTKAEMLLDLANAYAIVRGFNKGENIQKKLILRRKRGFLFIQQITKQDQKFQNIRIGGNIPRLRIAELYAVINIRKIMIHGLLLMLAENDAVDVSLGGRGCAVPRRPAADFPMRAEKYAGDSDPGRRVSFRHHAPPRVRQGRSHPP